MHQAQPIIDWNDSPISAHARLSLTRQAAALIRDLGALPHHLVLSEARLGAFALARPQDGTGAQSGDGDAAYRYLTNFDEVYLPVLAPDGLPGLAIDYMYRSASNHKLHARIHLAGPVSLTQVNLLLTALLGDPEGFIPGQVGLADLQADSGWDLDFEGEDHVWHDLDAIRPAQTPDARPFRDIEAILRDRVRAGYDPVAARIALDPDAPL